MTTLETKLREILEPFGYWEGSNEAQAKLLSLIQEREKLHYQIGIRDGMKKYYEQMGSTHKLMWDGIKELKKQITNQPLA